MLVIGTYRPGDVVLDRHPLRAMKEDLQVHHLCAELPLGLLERAAVGVPRARLGPHRLPPAFARLLHERTDGNPLFLVAVLGYLVDRERSAAATRTGSGRSTAPSTRWRPGCPTTCG